MDRMTSHSHGGVELLVSADAGLPVLKLAGELDLSTGDLVREALVAMLEAERAAVVDLDQVTFVDCRGLDPLVECHRLAIDRGWEFELRNLPSSFTRILQLFPELVEGLGISDGAEGPERN